MITKNRSLEEAKTEVKDWEERPKCPKCKTDILRYIGEGVDDEGAYTEYYCMLCLSSFKCHKGEIEGEQGSGH